MNGKMKKLLRPEYLVFALMLGVVLLDRTEDFVGESYVQIGGLILAAVLCGGITVRKFRQQMAIRFQLDQFLAVDAMTGLYNHRKTNDLLHEQVMNAKRRNQELSVLYFDVDDFKPINDNYGFDVGDLVLKHVVGILKESVRSNDLVGRFAGDEFLMILPRTSAEEANGVAAALQERLNTAPFRFHQYEEALPITVSIGMAHYPNDAQNVTVLLERAIRSKDEAKRAGKAKIQRVPSYLKIEQYVSESASLSINLEMYMRTLKEKDTYTMQHSEDVARYSLMLADRLGLTPVMKRELRTAGLFHDIGKILIPDQILKKPGRLTDDEYQMMKQHVVLSHEILAEHYTSETMKQAVVCHHERFDGKGYPLGLQGQEIPLAGRIMAIADAFSAMTLDRSYRKCKTAEEGLAEIRRCAGQQFDPELVELFCGAIEAQSTAS